MSQSDYITYKRMKLLNTVIREFPNVQSQNQYTDLKNFHLENTITNSKPIYHQLTPQNKQIVYNMEMTDISNCQMYEYCQEKPNRILQKRNVISPNQQPLYNYVSTYDTQYRTAIMNSGLSVNEKQDLMAKFSHSNKVEPMYNHNATSNFCKSIPCIHTEKILGTL